MRLSCVQAALRARCRHARKILPTVWDVRNRAFASAHALRAPDTVSDVIHDAAERPCRQTSRIWNRNSAFCEVTNRGPLSGANSEGWPGLIITGVGHVTSSLEKSLGQKLRLVPQRRGNSD